MEYREQIKKINPDLDNVIEHLKRELDKIRTDRATPSLVEDVVVDCFDQRLPLKQLASISCPEERQLIIQPWNKDDLKNIVTAVQKANSELNPMPQGQVVRISLPPMTMEYREKLIKKMSDIRENARVAVKRAREDVWNKINDAEKKGEITEDDKFKGKEELQKLVDQYNQKIDQLVEDKKEKIKA